MEEFKKKSVAEPNDKEIVFSLSIKAGKRIYYLDVKRNKKDELFLAITESKKLVSGEGEEAQVSFEKHKIFLYKEDFEKFMKGLQSSIQYINEHQNGLRPHAEEATPSSQLASNNDQSIDPKATSVLNGDLNINIDF